MKPYHPLNMLFLNGRELPLGKIRFATKTSWWNRKNAEEIAKLESLNTGKPYHLALNDEIPGIADTFRYYGGICRNLPGYAAGEYMTGFTSMIRRDPIGVVASIAPWNYPLMMAAWKIAPAVAAGNTMVLKPSEQTPLSTLYVAELIAGIFPEV